MMWNHSGRAKVKSGRNRQRGRRQGDSVKHRPQGEKELVQRIWHCLQMWHKTVTDPSRKQTTLQRPSAHIYAQSLVMASSSFCPFSALPVVEGVGVTLTQIYHGGSHYHSDHFPLTHTVKLKGSGLFAQHTEASGNHLSMESKYNTQKCPHAIFFCVFN